MSKRCVQPPPSSACWASAKTGTWHLTILPRPPLRIPTVLKVPRLIVSVPGRRKAQSVRRTLDEAISTACPATILRTHPDVTIYLDPESASELNGLSPSE